MIPEIGECVFYLEPESVKKKEDPRWHKGVFAGIRERSSELFIMTAEGVIKVRSYARLPEDQRWDSNLLQEIKGTPWEPISGKRNDRSQVKGVHSIQPRSCENARTRVETRENAPENAHEKI